MVRRGKRRRTDGRFKKNSDSEKKSTTDTNGTSPRCTEMKRMGKGFKESEKMAEEFSAYSGRLSGGAEVLLSALRDRDKLWMKAEKSMCILR